jgi:hypothetical protein
MTTVSDELFGRDAYVAGVFAATPHDAGSGHRYGWSDDGDILWAHLCTARPDGPEWQLSLIDVTSGERHRVMARDPLTLGGSVLCVCGDHGWFRDGRWFGGAQ